MVMKLIKRCFENDCSTRSFDRDIEDIRLFLSETYSTTELKYNRINNTYYIEGAKKQELEVMEYLFIEKILRDVSILRNDEFSILISHLLFNTRDTFKELASNDERYSLYKPPNHNKALLKIYGDLELAIRNQKYIRMVYQDNIGKQYKSDMIPGAIRYNAGHLYFIGIVENGCKTIKIKLENVHSFEVIREQTIVERNKVDSYMNSCANKGKVLITPDDLIDITIECIVDDYDNLCDNFYNLEILDKRNNLIYICLNASEEKFIQWYLSHWSETMTIIGPQYMKEKIIMQAQKILKSMEV